MKLFDKIIKKRSGMGIRPIEEDHIDGIMVMKMPAEFKFNESGDIDYLGENCYLVAVDNNDLHAIFSNPEVFSCFLMDLMHEVLEPYVNIFIANYEGGEEDYLALFDEHQSLTAKTINKKSNKQMLVSKGVGKGLLSGVLVREDALARSRKALIIYSYKDDTPDIFSQSFDELQKVTKESSFAVKTISCADGVLDSMWFCLNPDVITFDQFLTSIEKTAGDYNLELKVNRRESLGGRGNSDGCS